MKTPKDPRNKLWGEIERDIAKRAIKKDKKFRLSGKWKKFLRNKRGFKVFVVDGEWARTNLSIMFAHGGHGYVHEFIPHNEIWVDSHHQANCGCKNVRSDRKMSVRYRDSTILHEITEFYEMKKGLDYWPAHSIALDTERVEGILRDPYYEDYRK